MLGSVVLSFFEQDSPPIPTEIQNLYESLAGEAITSGYDCTCYSINGVEHNFRRIGSNHNGNIVNNDSVIAVANIIAHEIL
jgi:hypothetical protein